MESAIASGSCRSRPWLRAQRLHIAHRRTADEPADHKRLQRVGPKQPLAVPLRVSALTIALVDEYRCEKMIERERIKAAAAVGRPTRDKRGQRRVALSNESINKTVVLLANVLDTAVECGLLASNPARSLGFRKLSGPRSGPRKADQNERAVATQASGRSCSWSLHRSQSTPSGTWRGGSDGEARGRPARAQQRPGAGRHRRSPRPGGLVGAVLGPREPRRGAQTRRAERRCPWHRRDEHQGAAAVVA